MAKPPLKPHDVIEPPMMIDDIPGIVPPPQSQDDPIHGPTNAGMDRHHINDGHPLPDDVLDAIGATSPIFIQRQPAAKQQASTNKKYFETFVDNVRRWRTDVGQGAPKSLTAFCDWAIDALMPNVSLSTWRTYRCSFRYVMSQLDDQHHNVDRLNSLPNYAVGGARRKQDMTIKIIPKADLTVLLTFLSEGSYPSAKLASHMMLSSRLTGLRPHEWWSATLIIDPSTREPCLRVVNAKRNEHRGCGDTRTLILSDFNPDEIGTIHTLLAMLKSVDDGTEEGRMIIYKRCVGTINRACRKLWPNRKRHYSLYSARHSLISDLKLVYSQQEVAAIAGHGSTRAAGRNYARRTARKGGGEGGGPLFSLPKPDPVNIALVRNDPRSIRPTGLSSDLDNHAEPPGNLTADDISPNAGLQTTVN